MQIQTIDLKLYKSIVTNNSLTNGGYLSNVQLDSSNVINNLFDDVLKEESTIGSAVYRKLFCKNENAAGNILYSSKAWIDKPTPATGDYFTIFLGTASDTQATITPTRMYGVVLLTNSISISTSSILVTVENSELLVGGASSIIQVGDSIRISDKLTPNDSGNEEWMTVTSIDNTTDLNMLVGISTPTTHAYQVSNNAKISSLLPLGNIQAHVTGWTVTSTGGTCDQTGLTLDNIGTIDDTITCTILTGGTTFSVVSTQLGSLPNGSIAATYTYANSNFSGHNYFSLINTAWGGTFAVNDVVHFVTHSSTASIWLKRTVVPSASSKSNNNTTIAFNGRSIV